MFSKEPLVVQKNSKNVTNLFTSIIIPILIKD